MIMGKKSTEPLMTLPELSEMLGVPIETLYGWRHRGEGPVGYRIGRPLQGALSRRGRKIAQRDEAAPRRCGTPKS